ncbi:MAG TPA: FkbM family methyltransferase [Steroidobacteraceae bacterium]|nr:FkbM family methyltransferase [Steroidobacteraceae bacterium]
MLRQFLRSTLRHVGLDVRRYRPATSADAALKAMLAFHRINLVFDVGANTGQFGALLREAGYAGRLVSFEPLSAAHLQLTKVARHDPLWEVASPMAIGSENGEIELHVSGNSVSSSVLPMLEAHSSAAPESAYVSSEKVPLRTLDTVAAAYLRPDTELFIKIDTQGYEDRVLRGAGTVLQRTKGLQLELSLVPLYEGQRQFDDLLAELQHAGFELWNMTPAFVDPVRGRLLQVDATLFRR